MQFHTSVREFITIRNYFISFVIFALRNISYVGQDLIINGLLFKRIQNFRHLGALINLENLINHEIKSMIAASNR